MGFKGRLIMSGTLLERLAEQIEKRIQDGELAVGDRLPPEVALAAEFGVSRPLVREALAKLRARGYLRTVNGLGTFVRHPDAVHLADALSQQISLRSSRPLTPDDLYEARGAIESVTARLAAERADEVACSELARLLEEMRDNVDDPAAYTAADVGFHVMVAQASGNPLLPTLLGPLVKVIVEGVFLSHSRPYAAQRGIRAHTKILGYISKGDGAGAARAMRAHLHESRGIFPDEVTTGLDSY